MQDQVKVIGRLESSASVIEDFALTFVWLYDSILATTRVNLYKDDTRSSSRLITDHSSMRL